VPRIAGTSIALVAILGGGPAAAPEGLGTGQLVLRQAETSRADIADTAALSGDGRFVAFASSARLVPDDLNALRDVYVFDRAMATVTLESIAADGSAADGSSSGPSLSADGRYLAFESDARNLVRHGSQDLRRNIFVRDRASGETRLVSIGIHGVAANGLSANPVVSADGRVVAFTSDATNLVTGSNADGTHRDVYLYRRETGALSTIHPTGSPTPFMGNRFAPALSEDGRVLAFVATAPARGLTRSRSDTQFEPLDVLVVNLDTGATACVSCGDIGRGTRRAYSPSLTADGLVVAFVVERTKGGRQRTDVVVHDLPTSASVEITKSADASSVRPRISADGRVVVFESAASDVLCTRSCPAEAIDDNLVPDIFTFDREAGVFTRVSGALGRWLTPSVAPRLDARGETVVFSSRQPFGAADPTADFDLFVCPRVCS
jgi:Tol biopolymer transport system component